MAQPVVYVHGAGPQRPAVVLKAELDQIVFGKAMASSRVAYYADVRWPPPGPGGRQLAAAGPGAGRVRRARAIKGAAVSDASAREAADAIVRATLALPPRPAPGSTGLAAERARAAAPPADAVELVAQLLRRADRIAARSGPPPGARRGGRLGLVPSIPVPIFRLIAGLVSSDVVDYLFGPWTEQMRAPVRAAFRQAPSPVIVAHSLGTIITYDVLSEPEFAGARFPALFTLGSPLGIGNVQGRLRNQAGRPHPVPPALAWTNFADSWDPVALDPTLHGEFVPNERSARDERVNNPSGNNHDLTGYLSVTLVREAIVAATA